MSFRGGDSESELGVKLLRVASCTYTITRSLAGGIYYLVFEKSGLGYRMSAFRSICLRRIAEKFVAYGVVVTRLVIR